MNKQDAIDYINKWIPNGKQNTHAELLVDDIYEFIYSLEQQNTELQARIKQLEEVNKNYGNTILELRNKVK